MTRRARGLALGVVVGAPVACGGQASAPPPPSLDARPETPRVEPLGAANAPRRVLSASELVCARDADCGYDPASARCGNGARFNAQPAIVDQGVVCYCEAARCETLRVWPTPCESDDSCAVALAPRPHPIAASAAAPHATLREGGVAYHVTCERTNICTMHRSPAAASGRGGK